MMINYNACADGFKKNRVRYMNTAAYKNAQDRSYELTMSCDKEEAVSCLEGWMDSAYYGRNVIVYLACYDIWKYLKQM